MTSSRECLLIAVCIFAVIAFADSKSKHKPASSYFTICKRGDQDALNECVKKTISEIRPLLTKGIPALGLVPLEPLVIPKLELNQGSGTFGLKTTLTNFTFHGLSNYVVKDAKVVIDDQKFTFDLHMETPQVDTTANYDMNGQILVLPIRGNGFCELNFTELVTKSHTEGKIVARDGQKFIQLTSMKWDISANYEKSRSWFYNLFNGDKRLGDATNNFLNNNGEEAFQSIKHLPEEAFGQVFLDISSKVYDVYPLDELFPK